MLCFWRLRIKEHLLTFDLGVIFININSLGWKYVGRSKSQQFSGTHTIMKGDFLDAIFNCPFEMHELVTDKDISKAIFTLKDVQKELLYQLTIKGGSCQIIAAFREQTDRNIGKIRDTMLRKLRKSFMQALQNRAENRISLIKAEQIFYDTYQLLITDKKNNKTKEITNMI